MTISRFFALIAMTCLFTAPSFAAGTVEINSGFGAALFANISPPAFGDGSAAANMNVAMDAVMDIEARAAAGIEPAAGDEAPPAQDTAPASPAVTPQKPE